MRAEDAEGHRAASEEADGERPDSYHGNPQREPRLLRVNLQRQTTMATKGSKKTLAFGRILGLGVISRFLERKTLNCIKFRIHNNNLLRLSNTTRPSPSGLLLVFSVLCVLRLSRCRLVREQITNLLTSVQKLLSWRSLTSIGSLLLATFFVNSEEDIIIQPISVDLVVSCLGLHWTNDLPGAMIQSRLALKPDGLFLAAILGGETLKELRIACTLAQMEREGGISPRVSPLAQACYCKNLYFLAGFTLPGVDVDEYVVKYESALELIEHLRAMGETNALYQMNNILKRDTALATAAIYDSMFSAEDGTVPATFQVIYMTGWREHPSQQKAKRRGSATISFNDIQKQFGSQN
ncbi:hypothetical protein JHK87_011237 [Glycine soja]|nr:hypothetical protein JHK87_011237 [Glycine soja]